MIRDPGDIPSNPRKLRLLLAGYPGIGKSTLALSAPNPLHIDVDFGIDRIEPQYRKPYIQPKTYDEVVGDLAPINLTNFETLVFDTGGKLLDLMKPWAIKNDPKNGKRDGSLSLAGYGAVGREFVRLMDYCYYELDKHVIVVFHAVEEKDGESVRLRLMVEGQTRNNVWIPMDLGGYIEMMGNDRTLGLSNCERYYAKGTRGINGILKIPALNNGDPNNFLVKLIDRYNHVSEEEAVAIAAQQVAYENAMQAGLTIITNVDDAASANALVKAMADIPHALTSKKEIAAEWNKRIKELGLTYDKIRKEYADKEALQ
ncbi:MAG: ATP-binding protein [Clostridia bacterium]